MVLQLLRVHKLYEKLRKCEFYNDRIHYLGHIISYKGIHVDSERVEAIRSWPDPRKMIDARYFVGLGGYCRKFIEGYSVGKVEPRYSMERHACELLVP